MDSTELGIDPADYAPAYRLAKGHSGCISPRAKGRTAPRLAGGHLGAFEDALWATVSGLGDRDTTCAIVGGIVAGAVGSAGLPAAWLEHREPLPPS